LVRRQAEVSQDSLHHDRLLDQGDEAPSLCNPRERRGSDYLPDHRMRADEQGDWFRASRVRSLECGRHVCPIAKTPQAPRIMRKPTALSHDEPGTRRTGMLMSLVAPNLLNLGSA